MPVVVQQAVHPPRRVPRKGPGRWFCCALAHLPPVIGILGAVAQPALAQVRPAPPAPAIAPGDREVRARFQELLLDPKGDRLAGWRLCRDLGRAAAPLLWDLHDRERSDSRRRMVLLLAAACAGGTAEDERLLTALDTAAPDERVLGLLWIALGPRRERAQPGLWQRLIGRGRPLPIQQVAAYLAAARFPGAAGAVPVPGEAEPGLVAAACAAGTPVERSAWFPPATPPPRAELVWRACFLQQAWAGPAEPRDAFMLQRAEATLASTARELHAARAAAGLLLGSTGRLATVVTGHRPAWDVLEGLVVPSTSAAVLRDWLSPLPNSLDEEPVRLAVAFVMSRDLPKVLAELDRWGGQPAIRRGMALAVAWRLLHHAALDSLPPAPADLPEWFWVRWAAGAAADPPGDTGDARLDAAARLAADGRLPRASARQVLEDALWNAGAHPGLALWRAQRDLVRDLLLVGSDPGVKFDPAARPHERYLPKGLGPEDPMFVIAVDLFDFLSRPTLPIPPECRLR